MLDYYLFYDEHVDVTEEEMPEFSPVEAVHMIELIERGLLGEGEVLSYKGWHHQLSRYGTRWRGSMWDGPTGEERYYSPQFNEWED